MATALLIGTNAWASHDRAWLQAQFDAVQPGQTATITLDDDVILDGPVYLGTANITDQRKSITLDMYGHYIQMDGVTNKWNFMFILAHGELFVTNSQKDTKTSEIRLVGATKGGNANSSIFSVYGSYKSSRWLEDGSALQTDSTKIINTRDNGYFSHLVIGEGVYVFSSDNSFCTGITIDALHPTADQQITYVSNNRADYPAYRTDLIAASAGFAYGVKVEVYGNITIAGTATSGIKSYCIKSNGNLKSPLKAEGISTADYLSDLKNNNSYLTNYVAANHKGDTIDAPFVYVDKDAHLIASSKVEKAAAVYCSGYGKWLIEGECKGNIGVYAKSGKVDINDAKIESTATTYVAPTGKNGVSGSGSAIVVNSTGGSYDGYIDVTISGDTEVKANAGYAIEETVTAKDGQTRVDGIAIEGGKFQGGENPVTHEEQPAIIVASSSTNVTVYGGNVQGSLVSKDDETVNILDNKVASGAHITVVTLDDGTKVSVVSEGQAPIEGNKVSNQSANASVKWVGGTYVTDKIATGTTLVLAELEINDYTDAEKKNPREQTLTIEDGATLKVGRIVLGVKAKIIVEAGGKLIVDGEQGFVATSPENFLLKTEEGNPAIFLFHPSVTSNRHPSAAVEFISKSFTNGSVYAYQRFGIPTIGEMTSISATFNDSPVATAFAAFNHTANEWEVVGYINVAGKPALDLAKIANPFEYYQMQNGSETAGSKVTMKGALVGNEIPNLNVRGNYWNGFANSCMAPMNIDILLGMIPNTVDKSIYVWDFAAGTPTWNARNYVNEDEYLEIAPMQPFLIKNSASAADVPVSYEQAVYNPAMGIKPNAGNQAPRRAASNMTKAKLIVKGENCTDRVIVAENDDFSAEFDNGYDAAKYMNDGINMYVSGDEKMAIFATDNLNNTYVGLQTVNGGNYTIEFASVQGEELMLIDHETGASVEIAEGNTYEFTANGINDYRFEIVEPAKLPTAIENTEAVKSAKGIYTITGQFVGEMNVWNTLPAGIYVVNGEKRVK